jgi:hypothetical protein
MPRISNKKKATRNKELWSRANNSNRQKWESIQQQAYDFYLNDQLTSDEKVQLEDAGMPSFVINRITPVIEMMKYFVTANSPRWQAVGAEGSDTDVAAVHSDIADYCWYLSNGKSIYSHIIQDALTKSVGYFLIDIDPDADRGMGEVKFERIEPFDVFVDPMSTDFLLRDASYVMVKKSLPKQQLYRLFPDMKGKIKKASGSATEGNAAYTMRDIGRSDSIQREDVGFEAFDPDSAEEDEILDLFEMYQKIKVAYRHIYVNIPPNQEEMEAIKQQAQEELELIKKELQVQIKEKEKALMEAVERGEMIEERAVLELEKANKEAEATLQQQEQMIISKITERETRVENQTVREEEFKVLMENQEFAKNLVDSVKFYDTRIKLCCTLAADVFLYEYILPCTEYPIIPVMYQWTGTPYPMSAVTPLVGKQQELNKAHQIMIHNANLSSNLRWLYEEGSVPEDEWEQYSSAPGALLKYRQGFQPPTPINPLPLNNAFFQMTQTGKQDMEYLSGIYSSMQGNVGEQHETYRGLLAADEYGTRRIKAWMETLVEPALEHLGKVFKEIAQATYTANKVFRIVQPSALQEEKESEINIPIYNDFGEAIGKWKDYGTAKFDIRIIAGSTMPVNRWALLEEYFRWFQAGLIDDVAMLAETDVRGKENIIKRKSVYAQLKSQVDQLESMLKDREGTIETLSRQVVQAGIREDINEAEMEMRKDVQDTKAEQRVVRKGMNQEYDLARKDLQREVKSAINESRRDRQPKK